MAAGTRSACLLWRSVATGEPAELHARGEYLLNSPEVEQAFAALPFGACDLLRFTLKSWRPLPRQ